MAEPASIETKFETDMRKEVAEIKQQTEELKNKQEAKIG